MVDAFHVRKRIVPAVAKPAMLSRVKIGLIPPPPLRGAISASAGSSSWVGTVMTSRTIVVVGDVDVVARRVVDVAGTVGGTVAGGSVVGGIVTGSVGGVVGGSPSWALARAGTSNSANPTARATAKRRSARLPVAADGAGAQPTVDDKLRSR